MRAWVPGQDVVLCIKLKATLLPWTGASWRGRSESHNVIGSEHPLYKDGSAHAGAPARCAQTILRSQAQGGHGLTGAKDTQTTSRLPAGKAWPWLGLGDGLLMPNPEKESSSHLPPGRSLPSPFSPHAL